MCFSELCAHSRLDKRCCCQQQCPSLIPLAVQSHSIRFFMVQVQSQRSQSPMLLQLCVHKALPQKDISMTEMPPLKRSCFWSPPFLPSGVHYMASVIEWNVGKCSLGWTALPSTCYTSPGRQVSSTAVRTILQFMFDCNALPGHLGSGFVLDHSQRQGWMHTHLSR